MTANEAWIQALQEVHDGGVIEDSQHGPVSVIRRHLLEYDMAHPVVTSVLRKLNYSFLMQEAYWTCAGRNDVDTLPRFMEKYSDNSHAFMGAYGPHIMQQWRWLTKTLIRDSETRQAVITIWQPRPAESKDTPCTISMQFEIIDKVLYNTVAMRSSDCWIGLPYDMFNFACITNMLAIKLNQEGIEINGGNIGIFAGNRHIYHDHDEAVASVLNQPAEYAGHGTLSPGLWESPSAFLGWLKRRAKAQDMKFTPTILG